MRIRIRSLILLLLTSSMGVLVLWACSSRDATEVDEDAEAAGLWRDLAAAKTTAGMHDLLAQEIARFAFDEQALIDRRTAFANAVLIARADTADGQALSG